MINRMDVAQNLAAVEKNVGNDVKLAAVSKFQPSEAIMCAYDAGQKIFAESRPQELAAKYQELPKDIQWHFIGHLQTNKLKMIVPFVALIHSVDSEKLLQSIDAAANNAGRIVDVLLQLHVADEQTKQGFSKQEIINIMDDVTQYPNVNVKGLMAMATYTDDVEQVKSEFMQAKNLFDALRMSHGDNLDILSMGMSGDYEIAIECGATIVRVGSTIFGGR